MNAKEHRTVSKFISLVLRHDPAAIGIALDAEGWADIEHLLNGLSQKGHPISQNDLFNIVAQDEKKRYAVSDDQRRIRANQGHSIDVDLKLVSQEPPVVLYHGTSDKFEPLIRSEGIKKMSRHHVHLSDNMDTATKVGKRHGGNLVVLEVAAKRMFDDGHKFYQSENGVWLTDIVPTGYIA